MIREMRKSDLASVAALESLEAEESGGGWSADQLAAEFARPGGWRLVGLDPPGKLVISYILGQQVLDEAEIFRLQVAPAYRRRGLAAALLARTEELLVGRGVKECLLEVRSANRPALALYRKAGFTRRGRRRDYYRDPVDDAVLMGKSLSLKLKEELGEKHQGA